MTRVYGSADRFPDDLPDTFHPYQSVNFVTCHDGFSLNDLVSFNNATDSNWNESSWDCGYSGTTGAPAAVIALRKRQVKNFWCLLFMSNGTPLIRMGDEFLQTQDGRRNPYNIDSQVTWLDWGLLQQNGDIFRFLKMLIEFRKTHPSISRSTFWRTDVRWHGVGASTDLSDASRTLSFFLRGESPAEPDLFILINAYWQSLSFSVALEGPGTWKRVIDTSLSSPNDILDTAAAQPILTSAYDVQPRSIVILTR